MATSLTSYTDIDAHQQLMNALQHASEQCLDAADQAVAALEALTEHNSDGLAHADIRTTIEQMGTVSMGDVDSRVGDHNSSTTAHEDIRLTLTELGDNLMSATTTAAQNLADHNVDGQAHADLRAAISNVSENIGSVSIGDLDTHVKNIEDKIEDELEVNIGALQNTDITHTETLTNLKNNATDLQNQISTVDNIASAIINNGLMGIEEQDKLIIDTTAHDYQVSAGLELPNSSGTCRFNQMQSTLNTYYAAGTHTAHKKFVISNVTNSSGVTTGVNLTLTAITTGLTIVKSTDDGDVNANGTCTYEISVVPSLGAKSVVLMDLKATFESNSVHKVIGFMVAATPKTSDVILVGAPTEVIPGGTYTFTIKNLVTNDPNRFFYKLYDSAAKNFTFTGLRNNTTLTADQMNMLQDGDVITMTVPQSLNPQNTYFKIYIGDRDCRTGPSSETLSGTFNPNAESGFNAGSYNVQKTHNLEIKAIPGLESLKLSGFPTRVIPNKSYTLSWSGLTTEGATLVTISNISANLTITGVTLNSGTSEHIKDGTKITMKVANDESIRGTTVGFNINYKFGNSATVYTLEESFVVNSKPSAAAVQLILEPTTSGTHSAKYGNKEAQTDFSGGTYSADGGYYPTSPGTSHTGWVKFKVSGGVDPDSGDVLTYNLSTNITGTIFKATKTSNPAKTDSITGIANQGLVYMYMPKVFNEVEGILTVTCKDKLGEVSDPVQIPYTVEPKYLTNQPSITKPTNGWRYAYGSDQILEFSAFDYHIDGPTEATS